MDSNNPGTPPADTAPKGDLSHLHILVAEDNRINQQLAKHLLDQWRCQVTLADDGQMAFDLLQQNDYDLVLMDMQMPLVDGYTATKMIRTELEGARASIPVIATTLSESALDDQRRKDIGFSGQINKPLDPEELYQVLINHTTAAAMSPSDTNASQHGADLIDLSYLSHLSNNKTDFMLEILEMVVEDIPGNISGLIEMEAQQNYDGIKRIAHKMKSTLQMAGCKDLIKKVADLEIQAKNQLEVSSLGANIQTIATDWDHVLAALRNKIHELKQVG